ncbi:cupin domain-containing protein [Myxococcus sp. AS-1-15]|uniref:cupin domain-containing protein n=1 Tax=Myxococcus sp. AS-1-15 TaxID=2874600 RepID=UPI0024CA6E63|nr:hypothetical protein MFMH1_60520 [Myxococcus sp. MH1]
MLEGSCRLAVDGQAPIALQEGDFVLLPATPGFTISGFEPVMAERVDPKVAVSPGARCAMADGEGARTCVCSVVASSSIHRTGP